MRKLQRFLQSEGGIAFCFAVGCLGMAGYAADRWWVGAICFIWFMFWILLGSVIAYNPTLWGRDASGDE